MGAFFGAIPAVLTAPLFAVALGQRPPAPAPLAVTHVSIIDTQGGPTLRDRTVVIRNGRIDRIDSATASPPRDARVLEGRGKFLIPGLWDMHVHLSYVQAGAGGVRASSAPARC